MKIPFWKMHGAGNDFILVDDRALTFPSADVPWIRSVCARRTGIGSEGLILIQPSAAHDFRMRFMNPDGHEVGMCGNGARCAARLAHRLGAAGPDMTIETAAGPVGAQLVGDAVRLRLTPPTGWRRSVPLDLGDRTVSCAAVTCGVPHAVVHVEDLAACDVRGLGSAIRRHEAFAPAGTNADFVRVTGPQSLQVRTYERGVEDETLACGTGIVATALVCAREGVVTPPVRVLSAGGYELVVDFRLTADGAEDVVLLGPATFVFEGVLDYPGDAA